MSVVPDAHTSIPTSARDVSLVGRQLFTLNVRSAEPLGTDRWVLLVPQPPSAFSVGLAAGFVLFEEVLPPNLVVLDRDTETGERWRHRYLKLTYATGDYRPYEDLVAQAARESGVGETRAAALIAAWGDLKPWPEASRVLRTLKPHVPLAVVTNCSETMGKAAAGRVGIAFDPVVTAERAGAYKPDPRPYTLALQELGIAPEKALFVAGSAFDVTGAGAIGMPVFWHNHVGLPSPGSAPALIAEHRSLDPLVETVLRPH